MLTYVQDGNPLPVAKLGYAALKFEPEQDGITFKINGTFLSELPPELIGSGTKLGHAPGPISFRIVTGPAVQIGSDEFRIQFNRGDQGGAIVLQEEHPGNEEYRHAVQPGQIPIPAKLTIGEEQQITFPAIEDQKASVKAIDLKAISNSKLAVNYYIVAGPAIIDGDQLKIKQVPVNTKYPIKITVVAYQWGRTLAPLYQSAPLVTRSFSLNK